MCLWQVQLLKSMSPVRLEAARSPHHAPSPIPHPWQDMVVGQYVGDDTPSAEGTTRNEGYQVGALGCGVVV